MASKYTPTDLGFYMPAEWHPHERTWMAWPCREEVWGDRYEKTKHGYAAIARAIAEFEPVTMLVNPDQVKQARQILGGDIDIVEMSIDDSWTRDSAPCFVINDNGEHAGVDFTFNAWGNKYQPHDQDALMARRMIEHVGVPRFSSQLTAEGGGITVDGEGTLITTESCFLNENRNPGWTKADVEQELKDTLGIEKVLWVPGNVDEVETDGHVDLIATFVRPGAVLMEHAPNPNAHEAAIKQANVDALAGQSDAKGRPLEFFFIEEAESAEQDGCRFSRSYVNAYVVNGGVVIPGYGIAEDKQAFEVYQKAYPDRRIVQVPINDIVIGGGGIHCITQQQPA